MCLRISKLSVSSVFKKKERKKKPRKPQPKLLFQKYKETKAVHPSHVTPDTLFFCLIAFSAILIHFLYTLLNTELKHSWLLACHWVSRGASYWSPEYESTCRNYKAFHSMSNQVTWNSTYVAPTRFQNTLSSCLNAYIIQQGSWPAF